MNTSIWLPHISATVVAAGSGAPQTSLNIPTFPGFPLPPFPCISHRVGSPDVVLTPRAVKAAWSLVMMCPCWVTQWASLQSSTATTSYQVSLLFGPSVLLSYRFFFSADFLGNCSINFYLDPPSFLAHVGAGPGPDVSRRAAAVLGITSPSRAYTVHVTLSSAFQGLPSLCCPCPVPSHEKTGNPRSSPSPILGRGRSGRAGVLLSDACPPYWPLPWASLFLPKKISYSLLLPPVVSNIWYIV